jgi:hypothetical protein
MPKKFAAQCSTGNWIVEKKLMFLTFFFCIFRRIWLRLKIQQRGRRMKWQIVPIFLKILSFFPLFICALKVWLLSHNCRKKSYLSDICFVDSEESDSD